MTRIDTRGIRVPVCMNRPLAPLMFAGLLLLNCGCTLRVLTEALAYEGSASWAWNWLPVSALIELTAIVLFAINLSLAFARDPIVPLRGD